MNKQVTCFMGFRSITTGTTVTVWSGSNEPVGTESDVVDAGAGNDCVIASGGDDRIDGLGGNDVLEDAMKFIALCEQPICARDQFNYQTRAIPDVAWEMAA